MNWRRGIAFAAIHVTIAGSLLVWQESKTWRFIRTDRDRPVPPAVTASDLDPFFGPDLNPCEGWIWDGPMRSDQQLIMFADLPVAIVIGSHEPCNTPTRLDRLVQNRYGKTRSSEILILIVLSAMIAAQWFLLGAFPLIQKSRWWLEPGTLITVSIPLAAALTFIPDYLFPAVVPFLALALWVYWLYRLVRPLLYRILRLQRSRDAR